MFLENNEAFLDKAVTDEAFSDGASRNEAFPDGASRNEAFPDGASRNEAFPDGASRNEAFPDGVNRTPDFGEGLRAHLRDSRRIVIKLGSSSLVHRETGRLNLTKLEILVREVADLTGRGKQVILVSSGAIAVGRSAMGIATCKTLQEKQACAAVGQVRLMAIYQKLFSEYGLQTAQILMTKETVTDPESRVHARNTFEELLALGVIPVVNENDTVATYDIEFGDNDRLSAVVVALVRADLLLLLSDIDGLYTDDPRTNEDAALIHQVDALNEELRHMAKGTTGSRFGTGGMTTKLLAADIATSAGAEMIIASAEDFRILHRLVDGEDLGTLFRANPKEEFYLMDYLERM